MAAIVASSPVNGRRPPAQAVDNTRHKVSTDLALPLKERIVLDQLRSLQALNREGMVREVAQLTHLPTAEVGDITARLAIAGCTAVSALLMDVERILTDSVLMRDEVFGTFRDILSGRAA